jgi:membrane fusion protein, multidrug efflux system
VPDLAVERGPNGLYAFVVGAGNKVEMRSVTVAQDGDGNSVITQGLSPGENVVVSGQYELQPGTLVNPQETNTPQVAQAAAQAQ